MKVFHDIESARQAVNESKRSGTVGIVPTMGALHRGHGSLMRASVHQCDSTFATIFLNPTQFAAGEDLSRYPKTLPADLEMCEAIGVTGVLVPEVSDVYPPGFSTSITPPSVASDLEGVCRPQHFGGVATVVLKLFQMLPGTHAFFGKKDYQQWRVIEHMVRDLNVPIEIVGSEIIRDQDGLALSSRNVYLSTEERRRALALSSALMAATNRFAQGERTVSALQDAMTDRLGVDVDEIEYAVVRDAATLAPIDEITHQSVALVAARVGKTRLIDNCELGGCQT